MKNQSPLFSHHSLFSHHFWLYLAIVIGCSLQIQAQDVSLFRQHNGRYDFIFAGNTMNPAENNLYSFCWAYTASAAQLNLPENTEIIAAYLYWAGSGTGDFEVKLNENPILSERQFSLEYPAGVPFFSAFADVTDLIRETGNGSYILSELDVNPHLTNLMYCNNRTNFAGWTLLVIYQDDNLPLNQLNVYDGLQGVPTEIVIHLTDLNVIDNIGARIGFVAWEGDKNLSINEKLRVNGNELMNPPLNPSGNCFNGTNSFTGENTLYNMDLDYYNVQNMISIGDDSAEIKLTSGELNANGQMEGDFVMVNAIVTKLNSQLPDATVVFEMSDAVCHSRNYTLNYTVFNHNSTEELPALTPISIYANEILLRTIYTNNILPIGGSESGTIEITIPESIESDFEIRMVADDLGFGEGIITELNEQNNDYVISGSFLPIPEIPDLPELLSCNLGLKRGIFDLTEIESYLTLENSDNITYYLTIEDAENESNPILIPHHFEADITPKTIYFRWNSQPCWNFGSFDLRTRNCPPTIYNFISVNDDGKNDTLIIKGLYDIFLDFELFIYNRWGRLVWSGNHSSPRWDGQSNQGLRFGEDQVPDGTYFYVLNLNDPDYPTPLNGYLYITK